MTEPVQPPAPAPEPPVNVKNLSDAEYAAAKRKAGASGRPPWGTRRR
jgi:hypothetical protein